MTAAVAKQSTAVMPAAQQRVGSCIGVRSAGRCQCPGWVRRAEQVAGSTVCARPGCGHTQQVHDLVDVPGAAEVSAA